MIATGIKNAVLFLISILIMHYLIKNILITKAPERTERFSVRAAPVAECPRKEESKPLPLSTTCDAGITELKPEDPMEIKADCKFDNSNYRDFTYIKEYENEKSMNGGSILDNGLSAFDEYSKYFETYSCTDAVKS